MKKKILRYTCTDFMTSLLTDSLLDSVTKKQHFYGYCYQFYLLLLLL